ncbi:MAG TPA: adenosylcobinamide-phosphate synthase CbiB, partial [Pseudorhizobium sp.]|nr:adenosylcobinamide-phosphate synthase CbiB [Pseudorhizobium sp.]
AWGSIALMTLLGIIITISLLLETACAKHWLGLIPLVLLAAMLPAQKSLERHVEAVSNALEHEGLEAGRRAVSMIVGRDPEQLDEPAVCRAAIESLAENFSDGIVAPAFWTAVGGLAGGAAYKAANTADSMIGHRSPRHEAFGWAAARFDDLINLPASRLSAALFVLAAWLLPLASPRSAVAAVRRDARLHRSPNAGWPEAAMAGALGIALAGPRSYGGKMIDARFMGEGGRAYLSASDIREALKLARIADALLITLLGLTAILIALV